MSLVPMAPASMTQLQPPSRRPIRGREMTAHLSDEPPTTCLQRQQHRQLVIQHALRDVDASALWCRRKQPLPVVKCCRVRVERRGPGRNRDPGLFATHPDMKMWSHVLAYVQRTGAKIDQSRPAIVRRIDPREACGTRKDLCHSAARLHMLSLCQISCEFDVF